MPTIFGDTAQTYWQRVALMKSMAAAQSILPSAWYEMLEDYYLNNGLYDMVQAALHENAIWTPGMKPLRNPAHRAVEFHVVKLWAGPLERALPIVAENTKLPEAIHKIWEWSNWSAAKQVVARWFANMGDMFIKVSQKAEMGEVTRVYLDPLKPKYVTDFELDERSFLTYIRIDVPAGDDTHTEVWSKTRGGYRIWKHNRSIDTPIEQLGEPTEQRTFDELGFDFVPIVHAKFLDIGEPRGVGCFVHVLDKIDEANRQATRLHQILFRYNRPTNVLMANAQDASGRPLPPPALMDGEGNSTLDEDAEIIRKDEDLIALPGMSQLAQLVPTLNYADALSILNAQMEEISHDLPEILYYELRDRDLSGTAIQRLLGPAVDRVLEARGHAEAALVRANQMALTIAGIHRLDGFDLGSFEGGDFKHAFAEREVIPLNATEKAAAIQQEVTAGIPLPVSMKHHGYSEEEISEMVQTPEYRALLEARLWEGAAAAVQAGLPLETYLRRVGWTDEQLRTMGTQRLAEIRLRQEDRIPPTRQ